MKKPVPGDANDPLSYGLSPMATLEPVFGSYLVGPGSTYIHVCTWICLNGWTGAPPSLSDT